jgi:hypothetical protein
MQGFQHMTENSPHFRSIHQRRLIDLATEREEMRIDLGAHQNKSGRRFLEKIPSSRLEIAGNLWSIESRHTMGNIMTLHS